MNCENIALLEEILKDFDLSDGGSIGEKLEQAVASEQKGFEFLTHDFLGDTCISKVLLYFRRIGQSDRCLFEKYHVMLIYHDAPDKDRGQTFFVHQGYCINLKEALNLLQGRSVYKENLPHIDESKYDAWIKLDFDKVDLLQNYPVKHFKGSHGYDLEKVLGKYPIQELDDSESRAAVLSSLKNGNQHTVTFLTAKRTRKMLIEANPMYKTINIYSHSNNKPSKKYTPINE